MECHIEYQRRLTLRSSLVWSLDWKICLETMFDPPLLAPFPLRAARGGTSPLELLLAGRDGLGLAFGRPAVCL